MDVVAVHGPRRVTDRNAWYAFFGTKDYVIFLGEDSYAKAIFRVKEDGSELQKVVRTSSDTFSVSPDGKWVVFVPSPTDEVVSAVMLYPVDGGSPTLICGTCHVNKENSPGLSILSWSPDRKFLYLNFQGSIYSIPLRPGQMLPPLPASGLRTEQDVAALPGARLIPEREAFAGPNPSVYASTKFIAQPNIYRVPVP